MSHKKPIVALIGNPNSGKSSVFNRLTGLRQQTGNFPGVTVDKKTGEFLLPDGEEVLAVDFPGTYSLYPTSLDERIVLEVFSNPDDAYYPQAVVYVADATNLERNLLFFTQLKALQLPIILGLNMNDIAANQGLSIDIVALEKLLEVPVVALNGRSGQGIDLLKIKLLALLRAHQAPHSSRYLFIPKGIQETVDQVKTTLGLSSDYMALLWLHHSHSLKFLSASTKNQLKETIGKKPFNSIRLQIEETMARYEHISPIVKQVTHQKKTGADNFSDKADRILTHPFYGTVVFVLILLLVFQAIFTWSSYPMDLIESGMSALTDFLKASLPQSPLTDLLTDGIIAGLGGVVVFIPQITILFTLIAILEEIGYMARAVFLSDKIMRKFGLNGRSIVSLISGTACAIPAIMATRTITNWKERLITIFITPMMSCSARIPVYAILVGFVVPPNALLWIFNLQGVVMMGLYALGAILALLTAYLMKKILKTNEGSFLMMELPTYKVPHWQNVGITVIEKIKAFVMEAGKIILSISVILWVLSAYGPEEAMQAAENQANTIASLQKLDTEAAENLLAAKKIEASYAGHFGRWIEPAIAPLGFDWKIGIALITSFAAREVFVGTIATIYSVGSSDDTSTIQEKMSNEKRINGSPVFDMPTSASLLIFYVLAMQCMSTFAVVRRETKSWKWATLQLVYMTLLAYLASFVTYQVFI